MEDIKEIAINLARNSSSEWGNIITCLCCKKDFEREEYCFYDLCDNCFEEYKMQQYGGPWKRGKLKKGESARLFPEMEYFLSVEDWVKYRNNNPDYPLKGKKYIDFEWF